MTKLIHGSVKYYIHIFDNNQYQIYYINITKLFVFSLIFIQNNIDLSVILYYYSVKLISFC